MKIELDLKDLLKLREEDSVEEVLHAELVEALMKVAKPTLLDEVKQAVSAAINQELNAALAERIPKLFDELLDTEYTPVDKWGKKGEPTTLRKEMHAALVDACVYKPTACSSDQNRYTTLMREQIDRGLKEFQGQYNKQIDEVFTAKAFEYAQQKMAEKLGLAEAKKR